MLENDGFIQEEHGIYIPRNGVVQHRDDEYDQDGFDVLLRMQREHFWYRGRHKYLLAAVRQALMKQGGRGKGSSGLCAIDLGGGCGGWLEYLQVHAPDVFQELALGDSSHRALVLAESAVGPFAGRYQIDLYNIPWEQRWDVVFLLDVIEHMPDDIEALRQAKKCLRPGGLLFVTTPALQAFWTFNDEYAKHQRRYSKNDFSHLAEAVDMKLLKQDYFMFFLSPLLYLTRKFSRPPKLGTRQQLADYQARMHKTPPKPVNALLETVFSFETTIGNRVRFPWGTSLLGVFQR